MRLLPLILCLIIPTTDLAPSPAARTVDAIEINEVSTGLHQLVFWQGGKAIGWCHTSDATVKPLRGGWREVTVKGKLPLIRSRVVVSTFTEKDPEAWLRADKTIQFVPSPAEARAEEP